MKKKINDQNANMYFELKFLAFFLFRFSKKWLSNSNCKKEEKTNIKLAQLQSEEYKRYAEAN